MPQLALGLASDRGKPIEIESNSADIDNKKGVSVYRGDVIMTQGTTRITGDIITIYTKQRDVSKVVAEGETARAYYEEQQDKGQGILQAWGFTIRYDVLQEDIELIRDGELLQKGDTFKGENIHYNLTLQTVSAKGRPQEGSNGRVQMIIQPRPEK
ncbi:lipopolysaccharide transport periplasmic protein LptA [Endozoicomonas sp. (ex Bugula neritina AB1)]|nr:lipopolysaccharide transport periplasmic protein LptA [Endozoicomonas sp. (ex Bugula neritina AB1)]